MNQSTVFEFGDVRLDLLNHRVLLRGTEIHLTPIEFKTLAIFARQLSKY